MVSHELTDWPGLRLIASRRGIEAPQECRVMCGQCGVELTGSGLLHWPDCDADPGAILFLKQDPDTREWAQVGGAYQPDGPIAF